MAEALLNAPQILGSLSLLLNPTGLVHSVRRGVGDLIGLPLAALQARSASQFLSGLGLGSVSLVRHLGGWTLESIAGFSQAFARAVDSAVAIRGEAAASGRRPPPEHLGHGLARGLAGLAGGLAGGVTAVVRAPLQSYSAGGGVLGGIGRGLLGTVALPVSGALELVGATAEGLARSAGVSHAAVRRRRGRKLLAGPVESAGGPGESAARWAVSPARLLQQPALAGAPGRYVGHAAVKEAALARGAGGTGQPPPPASPVTAPVLLLLDAAVVLLAEHGTEPVVWLPLAALAVEEHYGAMRLDLWSGDATLLGGAADARGGVAVRLHLGRASWLRLMPPLRRLLARRAG